MKNDVFRVFIEDLNPDGNGVGRLPDGQVVFVPLTAPGDECEVKIIREAKNYLVGRCERLLAPSPDRASPGCECYKRCGGCSFRHITPEAEAKRKESIVRNALLRIGGISVEVAPIFCAGTERYRNKVVYPLAVRDGKPVFGYYARHTHTVIPHEDCPAQDRLFPEIAMFHVKQIERYGVSVRDEATGKGVLRHIAMRKSREGVFSVCLIASKRFPQAKRIAEELMEAYPQIAGVALNRNDTPGNVIFGTQTETLAGDPILTDTLCGKTFRVSPASFYQIHPDVAEKLYEKAAELADLPDGDVLLDLYCGAGTVGLSMIREGQRLCGVEIVPDAVENAKENAKRNGRTEKDTLFVCDDASAGVEACRKAFGKPDVIVTDPPRKGLSDAVIRTILTVSPEKIICISCDPATLAANCKTFCANGYSCAKAFPFNMFPGTGHVETVVLMSRDKE